MNRIKDELWCSLGMSSELQSALSRKEREIWIEMHSKNLGVSITFERKHGMDA